MTVKLMTDQDLAGKRVLIREDLNVPVRDGRVHQRRQNQSGATRPFNMQLMPAQKLF
jgi:3-phosphoglycerate kinase